MAAAGGQQQPAAEQTSSASQIAAVGSLDSAPWRSTLAGDWRPSIEGS